MRKRRLSWFKVAMAVGLLLGVMLLVGTTANYLYVAYHLVPRHLEGEATGTAQRLRFSASSWSRCGRTSATSHLTTT